MQPFVSIIVPVRNAERTLEETFNYLLKLDYPQDKLEIIVADGGSHDKTVSIIEKWVKKHAFITLVVVPNSPSPGHARNKAMDIAKGEYFLFTDGDCAPKADWIAQLLAPFAKDPQIGGVGGEVHTLRVAPDSDIESYCEQIGFLAVKSRFNVKGEGYMPRLTDMSPSQSSGHRAPFFATANVAYSKKAIDAAGGYFWDHPTGEDIDFSIQIQKAGYTLYYAPNAIIQHMHRITMESFTAQWHGYGEGHAFLVDKHATNVFELVFQFIPGNPRIKLPFGIKGLVYFGNFHMLILSFIVMLLAFLAGLILGSAGLATTGLVAAFLTLFFGFRYFKGCWNMAPRSKFFKWAYIRFITNYWFLKGGLDGTKRTGILYVEPSW